MGQLFAADCSEPDDIGGGFKNDKCEQGLGAGTWEIHEKVDKLIYP
jgi:hypothetical protein